MYGGDVVNESRSSACAINVIRLLDSSTFLDFWKSIFRVLELMINPRPAVLSLFGPKRNVTECNDSRETLRNRRNYLSTALREGYYLKRVY